MVGRYRGMKDTRISNSTFLGDEEKIRIGDHVFIGHFNVLDGSHGLTIEEGCQVTNYISILTHSSHHAIRYYGKNYTDESEHLGYVRGSVTIGKYTFIGPHSTILPGTNIGKGCIVSAYSCCKGDYPDHSIISGNPAVVTGSTLERDEGFLKEHPQLRESYNEWKQR